MAVFLQIVFSFPTIVFTIPLILAVLYWCFVMIGGLDIEAFDLGDGIVEGALDGVDNAIDGALDAVEGALDGAEAVAEGALEAGAEAVDVDGAIDVDAGPSLAMRPLLFLANVFRVGRVPLTISMTVFILAGWILGFLLTSLFLRVPGIVPHLAFSVGSMASMVVAASAITNVAVRPLEPIFKSAHGRNRRSLKGEVCEITTGRVDASFGQAAAQVGTDDLIFQVRCDTPNRLRKGDLALIVSWDSTRDAFVVEPMAAIKRETVSTALPPTLTTPALVNKEI